MRDLLERAPLHVLWLGLFPVLALLVTNLGQVRPSIGYRSIAVVLLLALIALMALRVLLQGWLRAGLVVSLGLLLFFAYGHAYNALRTVEIAGEAIGRHRYLLPMWIAIALSGVWLIYKRGRASHRFTAGLNVGLGLAILILLGQVAAAQFRWTYSASAAAIELSDESIQSSDSELPDIYYFVLDAYTSERVLSESIGLDNSNFIEGLRESGFYVADCSQANYAQTELSLAATLNLSYLDELIDEGVQNRSQLWPLIRHSALRGTFERLGYEVVAYETGYYWSEWEDADQYLAPEDKFIKGMSAFEGTLLRSTLAWALIDALPQLPAFLVRDLDRSADAHRERLIYVFDSLSDMPEVEGPKFVFAHIVSPHRPFVFDAQGNPTNDDYDWSYSQLGIDDYREGYRQQIIHLNNEVEAILDHILSKSETPPLIVIQGDHGPEEGSSADRLSILNAIYLQGRDVVGAYSSITPINTFRLLLRQAFGADIPLLDDGSYYSTYGQPFQYSVVENECSP